MDEMPVEGCSSTMLLMCSPQYLAETTAFRLAVMRNIERRVVRMVAIDEAHLYAAHGRSFRESIRVLREVFFKTIYTVDAEYTPLLLMMTATMPKPLLKSISDLTNVDFTNPDHHQWSSPSDFQQRRCYNRREIVVFYEERRWVFQID